MLIYAQNSHSFLHLLVITCITIQSISVLYDTNNKLLYCMIPIISCYSLYLIAPPPPNIHTVHQDWARQLPFPDYEYQCVHTVQLQDMLVSSVAKTVKVWIWYWFPFTLWPLPPIPNRHVGFVSLGTHTQHYVDFPPLNLKPHKKSPPPIPKQYADFVSLGFVSLCQAPKII